MKPCQLLEFPFTSAGCIGTRLNRDGRIRGKISWEQSRCEFGKMTDEGWKLQPVSQTINI